MTVPGTDTLRGSSAAYARRGLWSSAEFAFPPGQDRPGARDWPLCSYLELPALPESARSARLHARNILRQWDLEALADTVELLVSELVTNAVRAAANDRASAGRDRASIACAADPILADLGPGQRPDPGMGR